MMWTISKSVLTSAPTATTTINMATTTPRMTFMAFTNATSLSLLNL